MDFKELTKADEITNLIPDIENALRDAPEKTLACMGLAIHQVNLGKVLKGDIIVFVLSERHLAFGNRCWLEFKDCSLPLRGGKFTYVQVARISLISLKIQMLYFLFEKVSDCKYKIGMVLGTWSKRI